MKSIGTWIQSNPFVVLAMFLISMLSGISGLVLGWPQLYADYLSKSLELPVWLFLLLALIAPPIVAFARPRKRHVLPTEFTKVEGQRFGVQQVLLDGTSFERCEFHGTELIFEGTAGFSMKKCEFISHRFTFARHAGVTLSALTAMYQDPAFRPNMEHVFDNVRRGTHPVAIPPTQK